MQRFFLLFTSFGRITSQHWTCFCMNHDQWSMSDPSLCPWCISQEQLRFFSADTRSSSEKQKTQTHRLASKLSSPSTQESTVSNMTSSPCQGLRDTGCSVKNTVSRPCWSRNMVFRPGGTIPGNLSVDQLPLSARMFQEHCTPGSSRLQLRAADEWNNIVGSRSQHGLTEITSLLETAVLSLSYVQ